MAAAASASQANQRACTRWTWSVRTSASFAWALAYVCVCCWASWRECTTRKRRASCVTRPSLSSTSTGRRTLCPCHWRPASSLVRPGFSTRRGRAGCCAPHASSAWRTAQVRGPRGTKPRPFSRHSPNVRRLYALLSATIPWTPCRPRARHSSIATGVSTLSRVCPSRHPSRSGPLPSPLTPRLRSTCLRSPRLSLLCP
jgi:hypothetical protein